jgi:Flp pilus assembly protein TadD
LAAARLGLLFESRRLGGNWIAATLLASAVVPTLLWLVSQSDTKHGLARAEAFASEAPRRSDDVRAHTWSFLCSRNIELERYREAERAGRIGVKLAPTSSLLRDLALSEENLGESDVAIADFRRVLAVNPANPVALFHITVLSAELGRTAEAEDAMAQLASSGAPREAIASAASLVAKLRDRPSTNYQPPRLRTEAR